jgi:hypothetical protein
MAAHNPILVTTPSPLATLQHHRAKIDVSTGSPIVNRFTVAAAALLAACGALLSGCSSPTSGTATGPDCEKHPYSVGCPTPKSTYTPSTSTTQPTLPALDVAAARQVKTEDFTLTLNVLSKKCFGSAGCNLSYAIDPVYAGSTPLTSQEYTVTYQVTGGKDGPQINSFTGAGERITYDKEESIQTSSSKATLKVEVTNVLNRS